MGRDRDGTLNEWAERGNVERVGREREHSIVNKTPMVSSTGSRAGTRPVNHLSDWAAVLVSDVLSVRGRCSTRT